MKTYLVTGGAGFIGSTLTDKLLRDNNKVIVVDNFCDYYNPKIKENNISTFLNNRNFKLYFADIRDRNKISRVFDENDIDVVVHLAAMVGVRPSIDNPMLYQDVNCNGTQNILEEARLHGVSNIVMASSSSVYGNTKEIPFREDMVTDYPISPYAATKKATELMGHVYHELYGMNIIMLRFFTVYGPKQRPDLAITKFTNLMVNGKSIPMYGDGTTSRDYTYVDDIIHGIIGSCEYELNSNGIYEIMNLGSSNPISLKEMIVTIGDILGIEPIIEQLPMQPGDVIKTYADISKSRKLIKYNPETSFKTGVKKYVDWYKNNNR